ncbi:MAG: FGGY-family carbohydrate kinase [Deltaproteobacteria bacterium]|uniref:FGGY-family carbohydrate kinase n=1 Tax=Candidatus Zymogenus saltonus TaxID=2844893 RepID=A0A9D8KDA2_9DELT|nr:FGGY-family carbohydrate kinase [Candidatus Zymogenus saltonus]
MKGSDERGDLILAIDSGTQNVKAAIFDLDGNELALSRLSHTPNESPQPQWIEHDPEDYWEKMCKAVKEAISAVGKDNAKRIKAVGVTSQRGTEIATDRDGNPIRPAIVYNDNRTTEGLKKLGGFWGLFFKAIRMYSAIEYVREHSKFVWIKNYEPEIYEKTHIFMQVASFLTFRLTGEVKESVGTMVGMFPFDYNKLKFYPQKGIHDIFGITPKQLPEVVPAGSVIGHITKSASAATTIPEGIPVVVGGGDVQSALVGMGVVNERSAALVLGSTVDFDIPSKKYVKDKEIRFISWPAAVPNYYIMEAGVGAGFVTVTWFKNELAHLESEMSKKSGRSPEEILDEAIKDIPPGSLGLIVQPYWSPPFHRDRARGAIIGFTISHGRAHIYRAILEGLALETRAGYDAINEVSGVKIDEIRVSGGGSNSNMVLTITANVLGIPTVRMKVSEAAALGAAICAAHGAGLVSSVEEAIERMVHTTDRFEPNPETMATYNKIYKVYKEIYPRMEELYHETTDMATSADLT